RIRPPPETKLAEQPPVNRTDAARTLSSQDCSGAQPYAARTFAVGKASKVHMPSSAWAVEIGTTVSAATAMARRMRIHNLPLGTSNKSHEKGAGASADPPLSLSQEGP